MPFDRVVVSSEEIEQMQPAADLPPPAPGSPPITFNRLASPVPWWARFSLSVLVLVLPVLCLVVVIVRVAFRNQTPRIKLAWMSFLSTLLIVSGMLTTVGGALMLSFGPMPGMVNTGLPEMDERNQFPALPSATALNSTEVSARLKPLVIVVSPAARLWNKQEVPSNIFGAGVLLHADKSGYLFATANHVVNGAGWGSGGATGQALVAAQSGIWSKAQVVARASQLDLALLWMDRHSGSTDFVQPVGKAQDGADVFVIGHPEGLRYTLSTGIISSLRDDTLQISAAVSPGNSGGPVYDDRGNLIGIVSSKFDHNQDANAENLSFAAKADALLKESNWSFSGRGQESLRSYVAALKTGNK